MMTRLEFLQEIFKFFGKKDDELLKTYDIALTTRDNIDWQKLYKKVITEAESRYLPAPKWFLGMMPSFIITELGQYKYDNGNIVYVLRDDARKKRTGHHLFYTVPLWHETRTISEIEKLYRQKYGERLLSFKYYPENYRIIGNKIYKTIISIELYNDDKEHLKLCEEL